MGTKLTRTHNTIEVSFAHQRGDQAQLVEGAMDIADVQYTDDIGLPQLHWSRTRCDWAQEKEVREGDKHDIYREEQQMTTTSVTNTKRNKEAAAALPAPLQSASKGIHNTYRTSKEHRATRRRNSATELTHTHTPHHTNKQTKQTKQTKQNKTNNKQPQ